MLLFLAERLSFFLSGYHFRDFLLPIVLLFLPVRCAVLLPPVSFYSMTEPRFKRRATISFARCRAVLSGSTSCVPQASFVIGPSEKDGSS